LLVNFKITLVHSWSTSLLRGSAHNQPALEESFIPDKAAQLQVA